VVFDTGPILSDAEVRPKRNASNLQVKLREVNDAKKLTDKVPPENQAAEWIEAAKTLPKKVTY